MIGNDVVDLHLVKNFTETRTNRWMQKVFTDEEMVLIEEAPDRMVLSWRMWSMKESAYKANLRRTHLELKSNRLKQGSLSAKRSLSPKLLKCSIINEQIGNVLIDEQSFQTSSRQHNHIIHSSASKLNRPIVKSEVIQLLGTDRESRHRYLKEEFLHRYSEENAIESSSLNIKKNEIGMPVLMIDGLESPLSFSFSYHGQFGAFAFENTQLD